VCATRVQIPDGFIQEVLARADIVDIVGPYVQLKKGGANLLGLCPFHGEKSPSFTVSPAKQFYHCFGCGAHGDAIRFLMEHTGLGFLDAVRDLAGRVGMKVPEVTLSPEEQARAEAEHSQRRSITELQEGAARHYQERLKASPKAVEYLKKRGVSGVVARNFGLGYAPDGWRNLASAFADYGDPALVDAGLVITQGDDGPDQKRYDRFRDRIMFPIRSTKGEVIGFGGRVLDSGEPKYLNSPETPVFVKGRELYGLFEGRTGIRERGYALVVEGYMDVVALAQHSFTNAVATLGTACTPDHVQKLLRFTDHVVFSFDGDSAGRRAAGRALEAALPHVSDLRSFRFLFLPSEHDPDSFVRELGAEAFEQAVRDAQPLSRMLLDKARADADLSTPEGRARLLAQARPMWQLLPPVALREQILNELAEVARMEPESLQRLWGQRTGNSREHPRRQRPGEPDTSDLGDSAGAPAGEWPMRGGFGSGRPRGAAAGNGPGGLRFPAHAQGRRGIAVLGPEGQAARMLLMNAGLWQELTGMDHEALSSLPEWHGELFRWLERQITDNGPCDWPELRDKLEGEPFSQSARQLVDGADVHEPATLDSLRTLVERVRAAKQQQTNQQLLASLGRARRPGP
jgi:DNA primase